MKGKFKLLGHIGLMLVLVSALVLTMAPVAQAATAVTNVWVQFTEGSYNVNHASTAAAAGFTIHFTPTTAMKRGVDTITVWFPDGSTAMGPAAFTLADSLASATYYVVDRDGEALTYSATDCTHDAVRSTTGYRITVTTPVDLDAGSDCSFKIEASALVKTSVSESHSPYYLKVYTSKDTTPVLSDAFDLDATAPSSAVLALTPATAGSAGQYSFTLTLSNVVSIGGTATFIFPYGTTVPSSIAADKMKVSTDAGVTYEDCTVDATINQKARTVTITTPVQLDDNGENIVRFTSGAGILNPTTATSYTDCYASTSVDEQFIAEDGGYSITANTAAQIGFDNDTISNYSDSATMINMYSNVLYVQVQDAYGNLKDPDTEPTVNFSSSAGTGIFYNTSYAQISSSATDAGAVSVYYRDSAAGTVTITASATGYTSSTWTMTITPGVDLYDSNNNLIKTYAPSSTNTTIKEASGYHGGDYVNDAITAAVTGDTVKLGDGIYELDTKLSVSAKITLTSINGASSTILKPTADALYGLWVTTDGTAANPIIIDGLTFTRQRYGMEFATGIFNNSYDYVTVQNCVFDYIIPSEYADHEYGSVVLFCTYEAGGWTGDTITSATISNNTFTNCCTFGFNEYGEQAGNITVFVKDSSATDYAITGVTVSGNTLTDCNGIGIAMKGLPSGGTPDFKGSVTDNTLTNVVYPISVQGYTDGVNVLRNTITGGYQTGLWVEFTEHKSLVIKNNTITGCAGTGCTNSSFNISTALLLWDDGGEGDEVTVQYNAIYDNDATYSIYAKSDIAGGAQSCQYNYYGDATGPAYTALTGATVGKSNPNGTGKQITDKVTYYPWLHKPLTDVVADNASYQASNMSLVSGWNTLSTPVKLISTADSIDELIPSGMTIGYYYDATGWHQITTGYTLNACDAVYVKMSAATDVLLKFDAGAWTMPSKALSAGWNLISMAALDSDGKLADVAMASVYQTAAGLPGYSQVISPSLNATQYDMYYNAGTGWSYSSGQTAAADSMYAGLGYWIYMQNAATLAGFEVTPIAPDLD